MITILGKPPRCRDNVERGEKGAAASGMVGGARSEPLRTTSLGEIHNRGRRVIVNEAAEKQEATRNPCVCVEDVSL